MSADAEIEKASLGQWPRLSLHHCLYMIRIFMSEFIGMTIFLFTMAFYDQTKSGLNGAIVAGLLFTFLLWLFAPISGAQFNPVVSIVLAATRRLTLIYMFICIVAQFLGGMLGHWIGMKLAQEDFSTATTRGMTMPTVSNGIALCLELIATMILVLSVLSICDEFRKPTPQEGTAAIFPLKFGTTFAYLVAMFGPFTGGSMNPWRSLCPAIINGQFDNQWVYVVGPFLGGLVATLIYEFVLTDGASIPRFKAWFTYRQFDRSCDYKRQQKNITTPL